MSREDSARVAQHVVEVLYPYITPDPSTITGVGVSQDVVEVLYADAGAEARIAQHIVEVLYTYITPNPSTITGVGVSQDIVEVLYAMGAVAAPPAAVGRSFAVVIA